ncbi:MAG: hypothetical protein ACI4XQ_04720 [Eubacteriales bacterium]
MLGGFNNSADGFVPKTVPAFYCKDNIWNHDDCNINQSENIDPFHVVAPQLPVLNFCKDCGASRKRKRGRFGAHFVPQKENAVCSKMPFCADERRLPFWASGQPGESRKVGKTSRRDIFCQGKAPNAAHKQIYYSGEFLTVKWICNINGPNTGVEGGEEWKGFREKEMTAYGGGIVNKEERCYNIKKTEKTNA